jgi:CBS domain-containing protein
MNIGELCSRDLVCAPAETSIESVARLMREEHVGIVVITKSPADEPIAAGVVTDRDIAVALINRSGDVRRVRADQVMNRDPLVLCEDDAVESAIDRMRRRGVRRAPVVTARGALIGLISTDDLVAHLAGELTGLARLLEEQPGIERLRRGGAPRARPAGFMEAGHGI